MRFDLWCCSELKFFLEMRTRSQWEGKGTDHILASNHIHFDQTRWNIEHTEVPIRSRDLPAVSRKAVSIKIHSLGFYIKCDRKTREGLALSIDDPSAQ